MIQFETIKLQPPQRPIQTRRAEQHPAGSYSHTSLEQGRDARLPAEMWDRSFVDADAHEFTPRIRFTLCNRYYKRLNLSCSICSWKYRIPASKFLPSSLFALRQIRTVWQFRLDVVIQAFYDNDDPCVAVKRKPLHFKMFYHNTSLQRMSIVFLVKCVG